MKRSNPESPQTPLGTFGLLTRDSFEHGVYPRLDNKSRHALAATSRRLHQAINICELAYLATMPENEQVAVLCRLAMHLHELSSQYGAFSHTQIAGNADHLAIQGLVVARLRRSMNGVFASNLIAALTHTCLASLDPDSKANLRAQRALALGKIDDNIAKCLRSILYPADHPLVTLLPQAFKPIGWEQLKPAPVLELCKAIANPKPQQAVAANDTAPQKLDDEFQSLTPEKAFLILSMGLGALPKDKVVRVLTRIYSQNKKTWDLLRNYIPTNKIVCDALLEALPDMTSTWKEVPEYVLNVLSLANYVHADGGRWHAWGTPWSKEALVLLISSPNSLVAKQAWLQATEIRQLNPKETQSFADMIVSRVDQTLLPELLDETIERPPHCAAIILTAIRKIDRVTAVKIINARIKKTKLPYSALLTECAMILESAELSRAIIIRLMQEVHDNKLAGIINSSRTLATIIQLLPDADTNLELALPLLEAIHKKDSIHKKGRKDLPKSCRLILGEWYRVVGRDNASRLNFIKLITKRLSVSQANRICLEIPSIIFTEEKDDTREKYAYARLLICIAHKLSHQALHSPRVELKLLDAFILTKARNEILDVEMKALVRHLCQADHPRLRFFDLLTRYSNLNLTQAILNEISKFNARLSDSERTTILNILFKIIASNAKNENITKENISKLEAVLNTLNNIAKSLTQTQVMRVINNFSAIILVDQPQLILLMIKFIVAVKDKIPFYKNPAHNYALNRIKQELLQWLISVEKPWEITMHHQVRNVALAALCHFVDYLTPDEIVRMLVAFDTTARRDHKRNLSSISILPIMHLLTIEQLKSVIGNIAVIALSLADKMTAKDIEFLNAMIDRLHEIGHGDLVPFLCERLHLEAACSTRLSDLTIDDLLGIKIYKVLIGPFEYICAPILVDHVCPSAFGPVNTFLDNVSNIVNYIKAINHTLGTTLRDANNKTEAVKAILAHQTLAACVNNLTFGSAESRYSIFHLALLKLSIQANDKDLGFLFNPEEMCLSLYYRYAALASRVREYSEINGHGGFRSGFTPEIIKTLAQIDDPLIPHIMINCMLEPLPDGFELNVLKYKAIRDISIYCENVENINRLDELMFLILDLRKTDLAPLLMRKSKTSLSVHGHALKPELLSEFGIFKNERCSGTAVQIVNIIQNRRMALLRLHPNAPLLLSEADVEDDFVILPKNNKK